MVAVSQIAVPEAHLEIDALLPLWETTRQGFGEAYQLFRPFGPQNPAIYFMAEDLHLLDSVHFGKAMQHCQLNVASRKLTHHSLIWWNGAGQPLPPEQFDLVYRISSPKASNPSEIQIILESFQPHQQETIQLYSRVPKVEIIDWRGKTITDPEILLQALQNDTIIFAEGLGQAADGIPIKNRLEINPCQVLVLLTCPAGYDIFKELLRQASPAKVYIIGFPAKMEQKTVFVQIVIEHILEAIRTSQGRINVLHLAAATGQTESSIRLAIEWLVRKTTLCYKVKNGVEIVLDRSGKPAGDTQIVLEELERSLEETAAFRRYFQKTDLRSFFMNMEADQPENC